MSVMLALLTRVLALAQLTPTEDLNQQLLRSPTFWYWVLMLVVGAASFAWVAVRLVRRGPPPSRPVS